MRITRLQLVLSPRDVGQRLDAVLAQWLPGAIGRDLSRAAIRRLVMAGAVRLDGRPVRRPGLVIDAGHRLEARIDRSRLGAADVVPLGESDATQVGVQAVAGSPGPGVARAFGPAIEVLFEDPWLLAVAKPAGLLVHASADPRRADLFTVLRDRLAARLGVSTREPYLGLHHRLDVDTSGVILFTTDPSANAALARAFADHRVDKVYHALVARPRALPPPRWVARAPLAMVGTGRRARMTAVSEGGSAAETSFEVLQRLPAALLIEARPASGRKHQVRAHLSAASLQILGDVRYGGVAAIAGRRVARVMLHARTLSLIHPVTGSALEISCPYPEDFRGLVASLGGSLDSPDASR